MDSDKVPQEMRHKVTFVFSNTGCVVK